MQVITAIKKLEKAGYQVTGDGSYSAISQDGIEEITFYQTGTNGKASKFSVSWLGNSSSPTCGLSLKQAMS